MTATEILRHLQSLSNSDNVAGMARFGIQARKVYGVPLPQLKRIARQAGRITDWLRNFGLLARTRRVWWPAWLTNPAEVTRRQMERWAADFDNWAVCDGCCLHLFAKVPFAEEKAVLWCGRSGEFVRRAGFALMAVLAVHDKKADDSLFLNVASIHQGCLDG